MVRTTQHRTRHARCPPRGARRAGGFEEIARVVEPWTHPRPARAGLTRPRPLRRVLTATRAGAGLRLPASHTARVHRHAAPMPPRAAGEKILLAHSSCRPGGSAQPGGWAGVGAWASACVGVCVCVCVCVCACACVCVCPHNKPSPCEDRFEATAALPASAPLVAIDSTHSFICSRTCQRRLSRRRSVGTTYVLGMGSVFLNLSGSVANMRLRTSSRRWSLRLAEGMTYVGMIL